MGHNEELGVDSEATMVVDQNKMSITTRHVVSLALRISERIPEVGEKHSWSTIIFNNNVAKILGCHDCSSCRPRDEGENLYSSYRVNTTNAIREEARVSTHGCSDECHEISRPCQETSLVKHIAS